MSSVPRDTVLQILKDISDRSNTLVVYVKESSDQITIINNGLPEVLIFPKDQEISRKMLHRLQNKYGIPIHVFYHPQLLTI